MQLFAFASVFLLLRMLSKEQFGAWAYFLNIAAVVEVARIGLLQNGLVKFLSTAKPSEYGRITTASFVLNFTFSVLSVLLLIGVAAPLSQWVGMPDLEHLLRIYALTNISLIPFFQLNYIQQARMDFRGIFWSNFTRQGLFFLMVAGIFTFHSKFTLAQLAVFQIFAAISGSIVAYGFCRKYLSFQWKIDWSWVWTMFRYGKYVFGTNASTQLFKNMDRFMLGVMPNAGSVGVALYEAAIKITNLADIPTISMASILFPQSARRHQEGKNAVKILYEKAVGAILALMLPAILVVWLLADWILVLFAGQPYLEAAPILRITILFGLFIPYAVQFGTVLDSTGKPRTNFLFTLANLILLTCTNYFFIRRFGIPGAAYGTLLTYAVTFCFMQFYLHKSFGINPLNPLKYSFLFYKKGFFFASVKMKSSFGSMFRLPEKPIEKEVKNNTEPSFFAPQKEKTES